MTSPKAAGERFLTISGDTFSVKEMRKVLRDELGEAARKVPTLELPNWLVRIVASWAGKSARSCPS